MNPTNRGNQKKGPSAGAEHGKHRGVRPGSTTQNKSQRQKRAERTGKKSRVVE